MKRNFVVNLEHEIRLELDEDFFDEKFLKTFNEVMYDVDGIEGHAINIAIQILINNLGDNDFIEGYGTLKENGINIESIDLLYGDTKEDIS